MSGTRAEATMGRTFRKKVVESKAVQTFKAIVAEQRTWLEQRLADIAGYTTGVNEQLMLQQGQMMTVQAGIIEYLEELSARRGDAVGAELRIKSIVEQNIALAKADREARQKAVDEADAKKAAETQDLCTKCGERCDPPCWMAIAAAQPRTGVNNQVPGPSADLTKECICTLRDERSYADDSGADFACPHHGFDAIQLPAEVAPQETPADIEPTKPVGAEVH